VWSDNYLIEVGNPLINPDGTIRDLRYLQFIEAGELRGAYNACYGLGPNTCIKAPIICVVNRTLLKQYPIYFHVGRFVTFFIGNHGMPEIIPIGYEINSDKIMNLIDTKQKFTIKELTNRIGFIITFWQTLDWSAVAIPNLPTNYITISVMLLSPGDLFAVPMARETIDLDSDVLTPVNYWRLSQKGTITASEPERAMGIVWSINDARRVWLMYAPTYFVKR